MIITNNVGTEIGFAYIRNGTVIITLKCLKCKITQPTFKVGPTEFNKWEDGEFVQKAFPELTNGQREMFISGMCEKCFDRMFKE